MNNLKFKLLFFLSSLRHKLIGKYAEAIIYKTENGYLSLPIEDITIGRKLGFLGMWDIEEINILKQNYQDLQLTNDSVYIIGTHIGALLIPLSKIANTIFGFEPNPTTYKYLETNLFLNKVQNSTLFNLAVGEKNGNIEFLMNRVNSGGSKIKPNIENYSFIYDKPESISVKVIALDDFILKNDLPNPDLIVMDIEGAEFYALKGMNKALLTAKLLYIEFEPNHLKYVSNVSTEEFFSLFIDKFKRVFFMKNKKNIELDPQNNHQEFYAFIDELYSKNKADDLLFKK